MTKLFDFRKSNPLFESEYHKLFQSTFRQYTRPSNYLTWLYRDNPRGPVIGYDALYKGELVAHYACIPIRISCSEDLSLLSLNTVTRSDHQGKGLFVELAKRTYDLASELGFVGIVGVANQNSTHGFIRKLNFEHLGKLDLRFGRISRAPSNTRVFSPPEIDWLKRKPGRTNRFTTIADGALINSTVFPFSPFKVKSICFTDNARAEEVNHGYGLTVDWSKKFYGGFTLPDRLKPSPLNLIIKTLGSSDIQVDSWSFSDFDLT